MIPNIITLLRFLLTFAVIGLFGVHRNLDLMLIATILLLYALDTLDGYIARKRNETSKFGEAFDAVVDRIIENTFWIYFAVIGAIPVWVPIFVMARCFIKDSRLQPFFSFPKSGWTHVLTHSRISSILSCTTQMLAFTSLALARLFNNPAVKYGSLIFVTIAVVYYLLYILFTLFETTVDLRLKHLNQPEMDHDQ